MSDERPDEFFSWRSRLNPPDALPEQGLDNRDLTWEKLVPRLQPPGQTPHSLSIPGQPRRWPPVYRIAAACILLLLIPAALLLQDRTTHITQQPNTTTSPQPVPSTQPHAEAFPILQSGPTPKELARLQSINNKTRPAKTVVHKTIPQNQFAKPGDSLSSAPNINIVPDSPLLISGLPRSPDPTPSQNTLKNNQLRIVHINELNNPTSPAPAMTSIRSREPDIRVLILLKNH